MHNPILFKKTRRLFPRADQEWAAKNCHYLARKALKRILEQRLTEMTRPMIRFCAHEVYSSSNAEQHWQSFEPGMATDTLGAWREQVLYELGNLLGPSQCG